MCIPCLDVDCDGDPDCLFCFPLMCLLGYCCCKDCDRNRQQQPVGYAVPGPGYGYPGGPAPFPPQPGYYPNQFVPQPGFPSQPCFPNQPSFVPNYPGQPFSNYPQAYNMNMKQQPGSTIVSYVQ